MRKPALDEDLSGALHEVQQQEPDKEILTFENHHEMNVAAALDSSGKSRHP
jgi:hypothetical protein